MASDHPSRWRLAAPLAAMALLAAHAALAISSSRDKCNTFDELAHLTAGLAGWRTADHRLNPEGAVLAQRWAALPLLTTRFRGPDVSQRGWIGGDAWSTGFRLFYRSGNDPDAMLRRGRAMIVVLSTTLAAVVGLWSWRLFGPAGGLLSLAACALCPTMLAHGGLVTTDTAAALAFLVAAGALWRLMHRLTPPAVVAAGLASAALLLAKMSGVLLAPLALLLLLLRVLAGQPLAAGWLRADPGRVRGRVPLAAALALGLLLSAAIAWSGLWAAYGFRFDAGPPDAAPYEFRWEDLGGDGPVVRAVAWARRHHLLPEAYLYGFAYAHRHAQRRVAYLDGETSVVGWWSFFPRAFAYKTPLSTMAMVVLAAGVVLRRWAGPAGLDGGARRGLLAGDLYRAAPLLVLAGVYGAVALSSRLNIGHRHLLPAYAALFVLVGAAAAGRPSRPRAVATGVLGAALALESAMVWPDYLAFFNALAGGPGGGYRRLVDSSLDWGQDLPGLRRWLDAQGAAPEWAGPVYLSYFGTASPSHYGIQARLLPCFFPQAPIELPAPLGAGTYCISATMLAAVYLPHHGRWCQSYEWHYQQLGAAVERFRAASADRQAVRALLEQEGEAHWHRLFGRYESLRLARLCAFLRRRRPDADVGHSILIFRLDDAEVRAALSGPPVELHATHEVRQTRQAGESD